MMSNECRLCPRACGIDRTVVQGSCKVGAAIKAARVMLHMWEEPPISGTRGSGAIFFSGCPLGCVYCQNYAISRGAGKEITPNRLADIFRELEDAGAHNINLVTPTQFTDGIIRAMRIHRPRIPVVCNCGGYETIETIERLSEYVDVWLPDFKYSDAELARRFSNAPDYFSVASAAISAMRAAAGKDVLDGEGLLQRGMIVRHLVLPGCLENTFGVIDWLRDHFPHDGYVSLMGQYLPCGQAAKYPPLDRKLKPLEYKLAVSRLEKAGFDRAFIQTDGANDQAFIPDFDQRGV